MKLRTKLLLGFGSIMVLLIFLQGITMNRLKVIENTMNQLINQRYQMVRQATAVSDSVSVMTRKLRDVLLDADINNREKYVNEFQSSGLDASRAIENLMKITHDSQTEKSVADLRASLQSYNYIGQQVFLLARQGKKSEATKIIYLDGKIIRSQLLADLSRLTSVQEQAMQEALQRSGVIFRQTVLALWTSVIITLLLGIVITSWVTVSISKSLRRLTGAITVIAANPSGEMPRLEIAAHDEIGAISAAFNEMTEALEHHYLKEKQFKQTLEEQNLLKTKAAEVSMMHQGVQNIKQFASLLIRGLTPMVGASYGVCYFRDTVENGDRLTKLAAYADDGSELGSPVFRVGEGLVGQCALENKTIVLQDIPKGFIKIRSGLGQTPPRCIIVLPVEFEGRVEAVIEFASLQPFGRFEETLLSEVLNKIGITINRIKNHMQVEQLLKESQVLAEELQVQSEELQTQQEELKTTNEKLEEQYKHAEQKTREVEQAKADLEEKSRELIQNSQYKSEFLANMSHELRTPLNSLLVLSQMLSENHEGNLSPKQKEFAEMIYSSGQDLLMLINDVLDLSKVESGKMEFNPSVVDLKGLAECVEKQFGPIAQQKGISLKIALDPDLPENLYTDEQKLKRILQNLISNAFKFTKQGQVTVHLHKSDRDLPGISDKSLIAISVIDTGIGIAKDKQDLIFEAFQQADGTTSREYGGTGLGLSISKELSLLLGGFIQVNSEEGRGSNFTLFLPECQDAPCSLLALAAATEASLNQEELTGGFEGSAELLEGKKVLIVDDDMRNIFALTTILELNNMVVHFAENGLKGMEVLRNNPDIDLVLMDIMMPEMDGYEAIHTIRQNNEFKDLPIIALTAKAMKGDREKCLDAGASDYISKPVNTEQLVSLMRVWLYKQEEI